MTDAEILTTVKNALGVTGTYQDATLTVYINEVLDYIRGAGFTGEITAASVGVVARGVADLWNNSSGQTQFSQYFHERVTQLALRG